MVVAAAAAVWCAAPMAVSAAPAGGAVARAGTWRPAIEVPGLGSLNNGGQALLLSVSCGSAGNCAASGSYTDGHGHRQAFVVSERNGIWRKAIEVPGSGALNAGGGAFAISVSCASAGNCAVGGFYTDGSAHGQAFVVSERNGIWGKARQVPGSGALNVGGDAEVTSVSCASAGNCAAGGDYSNGSGHIQVFVVSERNGIWGKARQVPGSGALDVGGAIVRSVSCASAGNCAAGGFYTDGHGNLQAFVVSERNGTWHTAIEVPGSGTLNKGGFASVRSVSCRSAGNCAAGGSYKDGSGHLQAFVVSEQNGTWRKAIEVPGFGALNAGGDAEVDSVSCASAGNCAAGGFYTDDHGHFQAFVVTEQNGTWRKAIEVPGSGALDAGGDAGVNSVSCASAGNCSAGGGYAGSSGHFQAFVASETNGRWGKAIEVPGSGTLNKGGDANVSSVSCRSAGNCAAGGSYKDRSGNLQAFVVSQA
jgi:hypothetical protein